MVHLHQTEVTRHACSPLLHVSKSYAAAKKRYDAAKWSQRFKNTPGYIVMLNYGQLVEDGLQIAADAMNLSTLTKQEEYFTNHDMQKECRGALQVPQKYEEILLFWKGQKMFFDLRTRMALSPVCSFAVVPRPNASRLDTNKRASIQTKGYALNKGWWPVCTTS